MEAIAALFSVHVCSAGLTVLSEVVRARPDADIVYVADDAAFPYGRLSEAALVERVLADTPGARRAALYRCPDPTCFRCCCSTA